MAEAILSTVAGEIIMKLGSSVVKEIGLWWGVKDELDKLEQAVSAIQAVVLHSDKQPTISDQCKNYMDKLKEVLYDADDLLDDFSTEALRRQVKNGNKMLKKVCIFANPKQLLYNHKMAQKIKAIREKLDDIQRNRGFHIGEGTVVTPVETSHRETGSVIPLGGVIGREKEKKEIIKRLLGSNFEENGSNLEESVLIIPIVGFGGLGKTALAQFVFNDVKVQNHFEPKIWVSVCDVYGVFDVKTILKNIIKFVTNKEPEGLGLDQLRVDLWEKLDGKRYLLVLDDVWTDNREKWDQLKNYLMVGARGSRIVVTTRAQQVAESTGRVPPYILEGLSETHSWRLFVKMAFREHEEPTNQNIVEIGKKIVKRCAGVPLAIRAMGRPLFSRTPEEWRYFNTDLSQISKVVSDILPTLKLSYNNLEPHLKNCFAYCRLFPKDHNFDVETLIYLWIGQGFIKKPSNSSQSLEQVGYEYFLCLLWRCFFQQPEEDEWGKIVCCKMNNLMHDLAVEVAGEESIMLRSGKGVTDPKNTRHVSIDDGYDLSSGIPVPLLEANRTRTFLLPCGFSGQGVEIWSDKVLKFRRLRMLDLHNSHIGKVPDSIGKLKHLRYLDLSMNDQLEMLPCSIVLLQSLLVLKLTDCRRLKELPEDMKKLVSLEFLEIDGCDSLTHMPQGLGELTSLKKLTRFMVSKDHCGGLIELKGLNNLRGELMLENLSHVKDADSEYKAADLERKEHLRTLLLKWGLEGDKGTDKDKDIDVEGLQPNKNLKKLHVFHYPGVRSPNWLSSLSNLVNLKFEECGKVKYLPLLDGLSSLRDLSIEGLINLEYIDCNKSNCSTTTFFSSLKKLEIRECPNLKGWRIGSMETSTTSSSTTTELPPFPCPSETEVNGLPNCPCLSEEEVNRFPQLTSMAPFSSTEEDLETVETSSSTTELPPFPCLSKLQIVQCRNVTSMPLFPSIEGDLKLEIGSWKPLQETMRMNSMAASSMSTSSSSSSSSTHSLALSKLKSLHIDSMNDLEYLPDRGMRNLTSLESLQIDWCNKLSSLAGEGFSGLTSLCYLEISYCERLKSVSGVFQHCTGLKELVIRCCQELDFSDGMQCQGLRSLSSLQIDQLPRLVSLPKELQHVTTLQVLHISRCKNLKNLPDWIGRLTSLQKLYISFCSELTSLPEGIGRLTSLQQLEIYECPQLSERCGKNTGVDWPKISHIPNIEIDYKKIQSGVCTSPLPSPSNRSITNLISLKQFSIVYIICFFGFFFMAGWLALQQHFKALNRGSCTISNAVSIFCSFGNISEAFVDCITHQPSCNWFSSSK